MLQRIAIGGPLLIAALLIGGYIYSHDPFARDGTELLKVPLSENDPSLDRVGDLLYLGGLDIPRMGQNIGGLSGLRWDAQTQQLIAITDDARWVVIKTSEEKNRIHTIEAIETLPMLGLDGEPLAGKEAGDSESVTAAADLGWVVGFERNHRLLAYREPGAEAIGVEIDLIDEFGSIESNRGLEAMAMSIRTQLLCVERVPLPDRPNCLVSFDGDELVALNASPPAGIRDRGAVPTDADILSDGTALVLFRSYSPAQGNTAAIVAYRPDGTHREIATFLPPLTLDNFEGLAVREEADQTYLYIVSDDNFSASQRTLLMKFELDAVSE
ncbi:MAG: esterase-like activity of phytase family protein [Pseudomonadota bacterium]